jgi:hypothetical protein
MVKRQSGNRSPKGAAVAQILLRKSIKIIAFLIYATCKLALPPQS